MTPPCEEQIQSEFHEVQMSHSTTVSSALQVKVREFPGVLYEGSFYLILHVVQVLSDI